MAMACRACLEHSRVVWRPGAPEMSLARHEPAARDGTISSTGVAPRRAPAARYGTTRAGAGRTAESIRKNLGCHGMRYVRHGRGWYVYGIRTALQGRSKASCPAPLVRAARRRLTHVSRTYSTEAPGRTCKLREGPAAHEGGEAGDEHEPAARQHVLQPLALAKRPVLGTDRRCRAANARRRRPVVLLAAAWHVCSDHVPRVFSPRSGGDGVKRTTGQAQRTRQG